MNAISITTITTEDTGETIHDLPVLVNYHMNDGYDWMDVISEHGWAVIPSWGCDGWDLGQWPYVMVAGIRTADKIGNLFGMATYCEGDVKTYWWKCDIRSLRYSNSAVGGCTRGCDDRRSRSAGSKVHKVHNVLRFCYE